MVLISLLFLIFAIAACLTGFGLITGHTMQNGKFMALILAALLLVSLFGIAISVKLACPASDEILNWQCLTTSLKHTVQSVQH